MEPHTGFIVAAFVVTALVLGLTIAATLLDYRVQLEALARLSGSGRSRASSSNRSEDDTP